MISLYNKEIILMNNIMERWIIFYKNIVEYSKSNTFIVGS